MLLRPLVAKLSRPTLRDIEQRPRLFQRLAQLRTSSPAVWIGAPAGAGKTALVVSYLEAQAVPALWYRVDERDQHVEELFFYLRLAAEALEGGPRGSMELPLFSPQVELTRFARRFFDALFLHLPLGGVLVFDDYHTSHVGAAWQAALERCLASIPQGLNVLLISRQSPPPSLARALAHGELAVLESSELLLSESETAALARRRLGKKQALSKEQLAQVHVETSGWAAGVSLLLRSAREGNLAALSNRTIEPIFDYLTSAVFGELSPDAQQLLLHSACLRRFSLEALRQLAGTAAADDELLGLYRSGFFLESDDDGERVFRCHPLFRSFLAYRAEQVFGREQLQQVRARAARMLQQEGRSEEAFELYQLLGDQAALAELVLSAAPTLFAQGRTGTLEEWLATLEPELVARSAWLSYWQATCILTTAPSRSYATFEAALANFERDGDGAGAYLAWAGAVQALSYEQQGYQRLEQWLERFSRIERFSPSFASAEVGATVVGSLLMGLTLAGAESSVFEAWIARALALSEKAGDPSVRVMTASVVVLNYALRGDAIAAASWLTRLQRYSSGPLALIGQVASRAAAAAMAWHQGDSRETLRAALEGFELLGTNQVPMWQVALVVFGGMAAVDLREGAQAERFTERLAEWAESGTPLDASGYHFLRAYAACARGELKKALDSIELSVDRARATGFANGLAVGQLMAIYLHFELGDAASAREAAREVLRMEQEHRRPVLRYWALLIEADRACENGDTQRGLDILREALPIGRELQVYAYHGLPPARVGELCRRALLADIESEFVRTLVRRKELWPQSPALDVPTWPWPIRIRALGAFEVLLDDQPLALGRARMPLLILKLLVAEVANRTSVARVLEELWPESDGDNATHAFEMTLLRLRNQLGEQGRRALRVERGYIQLDPALCWTDTAALAALTSEIASLEPELAGSSSQRKRCRALAQRLEDLYRGPLLDDEAPASLRDYSDRLRAKVAAAARVVRSRLLQLQEPARADQLTARLLEVDPLLEAALRPARG